MANDPNPRHCTELEVPYRTYLMALVVIVCAYILFLLAPMLLLLFLSLLLATTLTSLERILIRHGWRKSFADIFLIICVIVSVSFVFFYLIPQAISQMQEVLNDLPRVKEQILSLASPKLREGAGKLIENSPGALNRIYSQFALIANNTLFGILSFGIMLVVSFYMLIDGPKAYAWCVAFFRPELREKIDRTAKDMRPIVESYIVGQMMTSTLAAIWVFTTAKILGVPAALTLGVLAAIFDILPGLGFPLNALIGSLMAMTVSPQKALIMLLSLIVYTVIENYLLVPYIYGNKLKLSPLVVLVSIIIAGTLAGIPGMIAILPVIAAYGPIERHWLKRQRNMKETVKLHEELEKKDPEELIPMRPH